MIRQFFILSLLFVISFPQTPNCGCEQKPEIKVLAVVNGVKIMRDELSVDTRTQVSLAQDTVIAARGQQLERKIHDLLLDIEAKRRGITAAQLVELEVTSRVTPPTEAEAKAIYEQNKPRGQSFSSVKNNIIAQLRSQREALRARAFASALRAGAMVTITNSQVTPPTNEAELARVFATVNGINITSRDIEESLLPLIFQVQQQVYAFRKRDVDLRINGVLLEQEAKRLGTTPQDLVDRQINAKVQIVSEDQARAFYNENKSRLNGSFSKLRVMIMSYLMEQEKQKVLSAYAEQLRKESAVQIYLTEPKPPNLRQLCCNLVD